MVRLREWRFDHARPLFTGASRRDSANSEDFLPVRFLSYGEAVTFSQRKRLAPDVPTGTTKSRLATQNRFERFPSGAPNRSASREILLFGLISGRAWVFFSLSNARFRETGDGEPSRKTRSKKPRRRSFFRIAKSSAISVSISLLPRVSVGASRPMS